MKLGEILIVVGGLCLLFSLPLALWTDRNLDFWLTYANGEVTNCPFLLSWAASVFGPISITVNIVGEIGRLLV